LVVSANKQKLVALGGTAPGHDPSCKKQSPSPFCARDRRRAFSLAFNLFAFSSSMITFCILKSREGVKKFNGSDALLAVRSLEPN
jgi:hypothetical protein